MDILNNINTAFLLILIAGLSTGIGRAIPHFMNKTNIKYLCFSLGLSAIVMLYVSFITLIPEAFADIKKI